MTSIPGYDAWKTASPYDDLEEWKEKVTVECYADHSSEQGCNDGCQPAFDEHPCSFAGEIEADCVGDSDSYTAYWTCPTCKAENETEVAA